MCTEVRHTGTLWLHIYVHMYVSMYKFVSIFVLYLLHAHVVQICI
jgi:hypothetical protein